MRHASLTSFVLGFLIAGLSAACSNASDTPPKAGTAKQASVQKANGQSSDRLKEDKGSDPKAKIAEDKSSDDANTDSDKVMPDDRTIDKATLGDSTTTSSVDQSNGTKSALKFSSESRDDNDAFIAIRVNGGAWTQQPWPDDGQTIEFPGVCVSNKTTTIEIKASHEHDAETMMGADLAVLSSTDSSARIGFEPTHCSGTGCQDDFIGTFSCSSGKLKI